MTKGISIEEKALLARFSYGVWEARKKDTGIEAEIDAAHGSKNSGSFRKILIDNPKLKAVQTAGARARRTIHDVLTLPWYRDNATGILNVELHSRYVKEMREAKEAFWTAYQAFEDSYVTEILPAEEKRLNGMFKREDYPDLKNLRRKFHFEVSFSPVPKTEDFRVSMNKMELADVIAQFEQEKNDTLTRASQKAYYRLHETIKKLYNRLADPEAIFKKTMIQGIASLVEILPSLNFSGDEKLTEMTQLAKEELATLDADDLRKFPKFREATANLAKEMLDELAEAGNLDTSEHLEDML